MFKKKYKKKRYKQHHEEEVHITRQRIQYKHRNMYKAAGLVLFSLHNDKLLILCIKEYIKGIDRIGIPGGKKESFDRQDPLNTAIREFNEETGDIFSGRWTQTFKKRMLFSKTLYIPQAKYYAFFCEIPYFSTDIMNEQYNVLTEFCKEENLKESITTCILWYKARKLQQMAQNNDPSLTPAALNIMLSITNHLIKITNSSF